jgi:chromosome segregation ATPase
VKWHRHAALRCEVHVVLKGDAGSAAAAPSGPGHVRNPSELKGWTSLTCDAIVEVQKGIEESRQKKQLEEDEKAAAVLGQKDAAEQERNQLAEQLKAAQQRYEELEAQRLASEQRAVAAETALLQMQVERDRLQSRTEQLETEITEKNEAKGTTEEQCEGLKEQCGELETAKAELETQLQVMTEERDVARAKEEEYFEYCNSKDEELVDTNNGYVYLTERLQEKEEEMDQLHEQVQKLQEGNEELSERCKKLTDENLGNLGEQQKLRTKLADEERAHKAVQERYMKLLKSNMEEGTTPTTASTDAAKTNTSDMVEGATEGERLYEDDFEAE